MDMDSLPVYPLNLEQVKKYAKDLAGVYKSEKEKSKELENVYKELDRYAKDLARVYKSEKEKREDIETASQEVQKMYIPLEKDASGEKGTTGGRQNGHIEFFGYYKGAKGLSGDYFDYKRLDDKHYAVIKCDVAGKGIPAALIMVEVATMFYAFFRDWTIKNPGLRANGLVYMINDMLVERGFKDRFASLCLCIINVETGQGYFCNAGDNMLHVYDSSNQKMKIIELPEAPVVGVFPSKLVDMRSGFKSVSYTLNAGDTLFFFTDGLDEAKRYFRNSQLQIIICNGPTSKRNGGNKEPHINGSDSERLGIARIYKIINAVNNRKKFRLIKHHNPIHNEKLTFDFSNCRNSLEEAVLALVSVEKAFRLYRDNTAERGDRIGVDEKIDAFLKQHFDQYKHYFLNPVSTKHKLSVNTYSHIKEDEQYDDLTVLAMRKK